MHSRATLAAFMQGRRNFARRVEGGLKPSSLRVRSEKSNFNDIISKYFPNAKLRKGGSRHSPGPTSDKSGEKYYLSARMKRKAEQLSGGKEVNLPEVEAGRKAYLPTNSLTDCKVSPESTATDCVATPNGPGNTTQVSRTNSGRMELMEISKEDHEIQKYKNKLHKKIWICLKRNNEKEFEKLYNELTMYQLKDEVSYSILLHGKLIISNGSDIKECFKLLNEMKQKKVHHSLVRLNERLLCSYLELAKLNVKPRAKQWVKILRTVWFTSALIKARRQKFILRNLIRIKKMKGDGNSALLSNFNNLFNIHSLQSLYVEGTDPLLGGGGHKNNTSVCGSISGGTPK
ncbi:conserved Plasmodium protein, unknown function [Plasmodium knowlesi strain H]|uniref:Uncharacterized protein n=3 Tax=Plasmodium knowlesi TaxID=5850 RepID=A0A5K1UHL0_PLAKH|nr:conserved protein, unknown function [Plasmodium knowlesi strain H]OTN66975.1 Uncharacterized protein PKNOH_S07465300 [Plasmodium knowlesi]CAA9988777.1 conserved protein, unknown function [Plasmodium knowlesi strain H]SBO21726.1 conserved Plasmodium protein, unknown function [Plasmodium knowlesi strain H]SBO22122.1 conserved Plasmodium protein, unknown function [Plasmodium knowlesi strain H]VVS78251.1 conserved protein, unknown function [Plasmodium knowlesi strain H]|eukprot:XP_002259754.1 hypothetical protein, conserved in Plasmodium species [Plasmodium knowlesi strain H]